MEKFIKKDNNFNLYYKAEQIYLIPLYDRKVLDERTGEIVKDFFPVFKVLYNKKGERLQTPENDEPEVIKDV